MLRRPEGSALTISTKFRDASNTLTIPTTVRYRLTCETTGRVITGWTTLTPLSAITVTLSPSQTAIINRANKVEQKKLTIEADSGLATAITDEYPFEVSRLNIS